MIEWLQDQPNKELEVMIEAPAGFFCVCGEDSKETELEGELYFLLNPCYGHGEQALEIEVKGNDFSINNQLS